MSTSGAYAATLSYDPLGRLWQVTGASGTTRFLYVGDELIQEFDGAGNQLRAYIHGTGADDPLLWYEIGAVPQRRHFYTDHQGSIVAVADHAGNIMQINGYDAWGIPNATNSGRFGYTGQVWLPEIGMWYYKARLYSPTLGRFLQTDPIGYEGGVNLYAYAGNDPIGRRDPSGLIDIYIGGGGDDWFTHIVENYAEGRGVYYSWTQTHAIAREIRGAHARGEPINVIGHSLGGASGLNAIDMAGVDVNLLITVDPVGTVFRPGVAGNNARHWVNVTANPESSDRSDWIAWLGGKVPSRITDRADERLESPQHHGAFVSMMREIDADRRIARANSEHLRRQREEGDPPACGVARARGIQCARGIEIFWH